MIYRSIVRPILFTQDAESIHERTIHWLSIASRHELVCDAMRSFLGSPGLPSTVFGLHFPNPVGLAAGMDKHATALPAWEAMGFGFAELGAATWLAQPGNPRPRVFRAIPDESIVNRMGFNNPGAEAIAATLAEWRRLKRWPAFPVGMNLGKSKVTLLDKAAEDYANSFRTLRPHLDFFVVNVSSPNTPNLRQLQEKSALDEILAALQSQNQPGVASSGPKPILVKIAPDLTFEALDEILELIAARNIAGIVATNTTLARPQSTDPHVQRVYAEQGGLSGRPLRAKSTEIIRHIYRQSGGKIPIIGVGGIFSAEDAWEKIIAGASLVQVYTGLVYEGPRIVRRIVNGLIHRLESAGLPDIASAVGIGARDRP